MLKQGTMTHVAARTKAAAKHTSQWTALHGLAEHMPLLCNVTWSHTCPNVVADHVVGVGDPKHSWTGVGIEQRI